jgi:hypothetical protein
MGMRTDYCRTRGSKAVSQLLWPDKDREVWFSLEENHEMAYPFGLHQLRNCFSRWEETLWSFFRSYHLGSFMVNQCANPSCGKPLRYLREGRIFVFDLPDPNTPVPAPGGRARRLQHFWLCGSCSETMVIQQTSEMQIRVAVKASKVQAGTADILSGSLAL